MQITVFGIIIIDYNYNKEGAFMRTINRFIILFIIVISFLLISTAVGATPYVSLNPSSTLLYTGQNFNLDVMANGVNEVDPFFGTDEVISFGFDLTYNPANFAYNGTTFGPGFVDDSLFFPDIDVAGSVFPGPGPSGNNILLATLNFTALSVGNYSLGILSDISNPNEGLTTLFHYYDPFSGPGQINMTSGVNVNPVPEPTTMLLLGSGLAGLVGFGRKRFKKK